MRLSPQTRTNAARSDRTIIPAIGRDGAMFPIDKLDAHRTGQKHLAVSVFVFSGDRLLIQQRAAGKYHCAGQWANTCCTHPHWGESPLACANRRLREELGITGLSLHGRGQIEYRADVGGGMVEHELVDLFVARTDSAPELTPDRAEVMPTRWIEPAALRHEIEHAPERFTPWLRIYLHEHGGQILGDPPL